MAQNHERRLRLVGDATVINTASSDGAQRASSAESAERTVGTRVPTSSDEGLLPDDAA
jgi:hypothetical protein